MSNDCVNISQAFNGEQIKLVRSLGFDDVDLSAVSNDDYLNIHDALTEELQSKGIDEDGENEYGLKIVDMLFALPD